MSDNKNGRLQTVHDRQTGTLVWLMADGSIVQDEEGYFFCMPARRDDLRRRVIMTECVYKEFGITEGRALWVPNHQVTDEEFDYQKQRAAFGLTPDPLDDFIQDVRDGKRRI